MTINLKDIPYQVVYEVFVRPVLKGEQVNIIREWDNLRSKYEVKLPKEQEIPHIQWGSSRGELYGEFYEWCQKNRSFDLDCRLHTHGGPIDNRGYISDEMTRIAFAAYLAGRTLNTQSHNLLAEALEGFLSIVSDSRGVAGYHLNGDVADWDEFCEVHDAENALAAYREGGKR